MGWKSATYLVLAAALCGAGCSRQAKVPQVNPVAACGSSAVLAQLKQALLPAPSFADPRYLDRVQHARIALSDLRLAGYNPDAAASNCSATAYLMARGVPQGGAATMQITYTAGRGPDGQVYLNGLEATAGGEVDQFAKLLQPKEAHAAAAAKPELPPPPPPAPAPKPEVQNATGDRPGLSDETQRLVDQAGDTRAADDNTSDNNVSSPQPNSLR
jgi:hypothetical protein